MNKKRVKFLLAIETSCDETAAAVASTDGQILSNVVSSSVKLHSKYGGVIPEIACRFHVEYISSVINKAITDSGISLEKIQQICVTNGPGLVGALLVGVQTAKAIAYSRRIGILPINHLRAHLHAAFIENNDLKYPFVGLVISGGHTSLVYVEGFGKYKLLGQTRDDAVGEAFDKVAKILGLAYPGGPAIEKLANNGLSNAFRFPQVLLEKDSLDFSLSGIKTAVLYTVKPPKSSEEEYLENIKNQTLVNNICASFQDAVFKTVIHKALFACEKFKTKRLVIGGGVSANGYFRKCLTERANQKSTKVFYPSKKYCVDNAAMVALYGVDFYRRYGIKYGYNFKVNPNLGF